MRKKYFLWFVFIALAAFFLLIAVRSRNSQLYSNYSLVIYVKEDGKLYVNEKLKTIGEVKIIISDLVAKKEIQNQCPVLLKGIVVQSILVVFPSATTTFRELDSVFTVLESPNTCANVFITYPDFSSQAPLIRAVYRENSAVAFYSGNWLKFESDNLVGYDVRNKVFSSETGLRSEKNICLIVNMEYATIADFLNAVEVCKGMNTKYYSVFYRQAISEAEVRSESWKPSRFITVPEEITKKAYTSDTTEDSPENRK